MKKNPVNTNVTENPTAPQIDLDIVKVVLISVLIYFSIYPTSVLLS